MDAKSAVRRILQLLASAAVLLPVALIGEAHASHIVVQPIQVCDDSNANCAGVNLYTAETNKIWAQASLGVQFLPQLQIDSTAFLNVNITNAARPSGAANEFVSLYQAGDLLNDGSITRIINMYFVDNIDGGSGITYGLGCGAPVFAGFCQNEIGVIISDDIIAANRIDTVAHELGHVLGLTHDDFGAGLSAPTLADATSNLMSGGSFCYPDATHDPSCPAGQNLFDRSIPANINNIAPDGNNLDRLTQDQRSTARSSDFVIPEPASIAFFGLGLAGLGFARRRRAA